MRTLWQLALAAVAESVESPQVGPGIGFLPPKVRIRLLERILSHDLLTRRSWPYVMRKTFFEDLTELRLPRSDQMDDRFMNTIASSGCQLRRLFLSVPMIPTDERRAKLTGRGVSALLGTQDSLEVLRLIWCVNFKQGVLNRIQSDRLKIVEIHGDGVCSCFANSGYVVRDDEVQLYQRDVSFLAINNRTITRLHLDGVILNFADCHSLFSALSNSLEHLVIKIIRYYAYCERVHSFYGRDLIPFLEMIDSKCRRLRYFSCFCLKTDWQQNRQLRMESNSLETLALEGHVFELPLLLPATLRKLKLSLNGFESREYFATLCHERLPNLERLYVQLVENYTVADGHGLLALFSYLGPKIVSITDVNAAVFSQVAFLVCEYCVNLKTLGVLRLTSSNVSGCQLLPLFQDEERASKLKHLRLTIDHASQALLSFVVRNCLRLRTLDVAYCQTIDDSLLTQLAVNCGDVLKTLDVSYCPKITDEGVRSIAVNCASSLEEICMLRTPVGDDGVLALASCCSRLRVCRFDEKLISDNTKKRLRQSCADRVIFMDR